MQQAAIKVLWGCLLVGLVAGVAMSFHFDAPRLTEEQIERWR